MNVVVFYEHKVRELPALRVLRKGLEDSGHNVSIYSIAFEWYDAYKLAKRQRVDLLLVPWCYSSDQFWRFSPFYELNPDLKLVNLHHEEVTAKITECVLMPRDQIARDYPFHFCWTDYFKKKLEEAGVASNRIFVVGNLRLRPVGFMSPSKQDMARQYGLDASKQWILFGESRRIDNISLEKSKQDFTQGAGVSVEACEAFFARWDESLRIFIKQVEELPEGFFQKYELIYRPHPGSTVEFNLGKHPRVIFERPIADWLNAVDVFCTWQSTSAFEAELAGLPVFLNECVDIPESERMPGVSEYPSIRSLAELDDTLVEKCRETLKLHPIYPRYLGANEPGTLDKHIEALEWINAQKEELPIVPYDKRWKAKMALSEVIIKVMRRLNVIRKLHWPRTASMMHDDIPFQDPECKGLHL